MHRHIILKKHEIKNEESEDMIKTEARRLSDRVNFTLRTGFLGLLKC